VACRILPLSRLLTLAALIAWTTNAQSKLEGSVEARCIFAGDSRETTTTVESRLADSLIFTDAYNNWASASYAVDLARGSLGLYAKGENPAHEYGAAGAWAFARFTEYLTFTVAPGTYQEDLIVTLSGEVNGHLSRSAANGYHIADLHYGLYLHNGMNQVGGDYSLMSGCTVNDGGP